MSVGIAAAVVGGVALGGLLGGDAPDTSGMNESARQQAALSKEQLDWQKEIYKEQAPARARAEQRANAISDAQLSSMGLSDAIAKDYYDFSKSTFRPIEQRIANEAQAYDTPERREQKAAEAMAGVGSQVDAGRDTAMRELASRGVDPSSGSAALALSRTAVTGGALKAAAGNAARDNVETVGSARLMDAASLNRNLASSQATNASLALQAGNSSSQNAVSALIPQQNANSQMQSAYSGAQAGLAGAASTYGQISRINQAAGDDSALYGALGQAAGAYFGAKSDENEKTDIKDVEGEVALAAARRMPVKSWQYRPDSSAADGGKTHIGPMAQDVNAAAGERVAPGGTEIDLVSMNGIALASVQNLDKRLKRVERKGARNGK